MRPPGAASPRVLWAILRSHSEPLTLDQLRSDLSHETAAKIARLSGLIQEWRLGRLRPADPADIEAILRDLERIYLRHARLAGASFATFGRLARLVSCLGSMRGILASRRAADARAPEAIERFAGRIAALRSDSQALSDALSARHGARFADLVEAALEEVRSESGHGDPGGIGVTLEGAADAPRTWVPRKDAGPWSDVIRNLVRNAVQATQDRRRDARGAAPAAGPRPGPASPPPDGVVVRVRPLPVRSGTTVEVIDQGVGMSPAALEAMWRAGCSSHGAQRGHGLTESKRAFVESRAALEVRSAEGVGTCVRIDLPHRDVAIRAPRLWALPPLVAPPLAALAVAAVVWSVSFPPAIVDVEVANGQLARALDARGRLVWQRDMGEEVLPNYLGHLFAPVSELERVNRHLIVPARWPWPANVILATQPPQGPGHLWRLGLGGRTRWERTLRWIPPRVVHTGDLKCMFQATTPWNRGERGAIAMNVRDADWSSTAIEFFGPAGDSLGAYYHPGQLEYRASMDLDGDGRTELILSGKNNRAKEDRSFLAEDPGEDWVDCLVMLEPPRVDGQAYPYTGWVGMPPAREEGYLLIPPLRPGPAKHLQRPVIVKLNLGQAAVPGRARVELQIEDGRIYQLDCHLRPLSCGVGDQTWAATLAPTRALAPLIYVHDGRREAIDLPIRREP